MPDRYEWFTVEGVIVGWLDTSDDENASIYEHDVAVVQGNDGHSFLRWLGNDWKQIDPEPGYIVRGTSGQVEAVEQVAAIGTRIRFDTNLREQQEYAHIANGKAHPDE